MSIRYLFILASIVFACVALRPVSEQAKESADRANWEFVLFAAGFAFMGWKYES